MTNAVATIDHSARAHSAVGGSSAERVMRCPGSVLLSAQYPNIESEFAATGTALHEAIDLILGSETLKTERDVIGVRFNGVVMTEEMFEEAIVPALEQFDKIDQELGGIEYFNEQRVIFPMSMPLRDEDGNIIGLDNEGAFGTVDIVGSSKDRSIVWDWKFGRGVAVEAEGNEQLMYYAWAAMHTPETARFFSKDKPVELFICQPMVNDGEPFTRWMTTAVQLEAFARELTRAVEIAYEPDPPFNLGAWCKFCNAKAGCPAYNKLARPTLEMTREQLVEKLDELLPYADGFIALGKEIKDLAHFELERGGRIKGWKLVGNKKTRSWIDEEKALRWFAKIGIPATERHVKKMISPKGAEDALKRNKLPVELPSHLVKSESTGTTLAPESDKRPAVAAAGGALKMLAASLAARS